MNPKHVFAVTLVFFGATSAFGQITLNSVASRSIGSPALNISSFNPNLVEGREFYLPQGVALDTSTTPPAIYVSDSVNNRVLAWKDANGFKSGQEADLQIGQPDLVTTFQGGPGTGFSHGLSRPTGIAVYKGDLYVADSGNNRVLRYPAPFDQIGKQQRQFPQADMYIGQPSINGRNPNYTGQVSAQGIFLSNSSSVFQSNIAFDSSGNLWMTDPGNVRVLRFKAADIASGGGGLFADLEIGQLDFISIQTALTNDAAGSRRTNQFARPSALAFDPSGNLYVTDGAGNISRVLVFTQPFTTGMSAARLMGVFPANFVPPTGTAAQQALFDVTLMADPEAIFFPTGSAAGVGVVDSGSSRILLFDSYANWPTDGSPPQAKSIIGQPSSCPAYPSAACRSINNGNPRPSDKTFYFPTGVAYSGTDLFVVDQYNHRVLDLPQQGSTFGSAIRVLGQDRLDTNSINLIEGREFNFANIVGTDAAIAIDSSGSTPHVYVSDPGNNRVLGFKDLRSLKPGAKADIVLGQPDMQTAIANYPSGDVNKPTATNLFRPIGLLVDSKGNLYVADSLNGRVLRFQAPFAYQGAAPEPADLVIGKPNFTTGNFPDANNSNLSVPYGLAFSGVNGLVVSDQGNNRVLYFPMTNGTFTPPADNGKAATVVFGQPTFTSSARGSDLASMNSPHHVSCDDSGFVYVADTGNNRILIFPDPHSNTTPPAGEAAPTFIGGLTAPQGVFVNTGTAVKPGTEEIWVANTGAGTSLRYQNYAAVLLNNGSISTIQEVSSNSSPAFLLHPLALAQDQNGDLFVADDGNRVAFYYPGLSVCNGATFMATFQAAAPNLCAPFDNSSGIVLAPHPLAPGVLATIFPCTNCAGDQFGDQVAVFNGTYPMATTLADLQVLFDGVPTPLYYVGGPIPGNDHGQINFVVPNGARAVGSAAVEVQQASTGQILGAAQVPMAAASPGLLIHANNISPSQRYVAAINIKDSSINTSTNPVARGDFISIYATGQGFVPNAPPDGTGGVVGSPAPLTVLLNAVDVNDTSKNGGETQQHIQYSGLDLYPGIWQINVQIPNNVVPSTSAAPTALNIVVNGTANADRGLTWKTYIFVK